ncbi:formate dehydrogenase subunit alpha [Deferribacteraceae bacterium V6Fe1]|nr:formate dehydrogenase subunit alpha [Deferribacteraceae bacterium V6Fe1]
MIKITIDGNQINVRENITIFEACLEAGIEIPTICHDKYLPHIGRCKVCIVNADNQYVTSCNTKIYDGMNLVTNTNELNEIRNTNIQLMLESVDFKKLPENLKKLAVSSIKRVSTTNSQKTINNPFFSFNPDLCFLCGKCVSACSNLQGRFIWNFRNKGKKLGLSIGIYESFEDAGCEFSGTCVDFCPTGAISHNRRLSKIVSKCETICSYCGVGCQIELFFDGENIISKPIQKSEKYSSLCVKGRYGNSYVLNSQRLKNPLVRKYLLENLSKKEATKDNDHELVEVSWEKALDIISDNLIRVYENYGGDAISFMSSAKCTNEENYLFQKLARQIFKTNNVDHCARLCHSSTVVGLIETVGSGAMTNGMDDIAENAKTVFIIGANVTEQHPVFGVKIRRAVMERKINLIVADPRFIDIAEFSDIYLNIKSGTDIYLINALCRIILENNWQDDTFINERCENFEEFKEYILRFDIDEAIDKTGIDYDTLFKSAKLIATEKPTAAIWAMGVTQHIYGVDNVIAISNLQLLTGNVGLKGGGLNPLRGQNNVQGACDMGGLPDVFPGYQKVIDKDVVYKFQEFWKFEHDTQLSNTPGYTVTEMIDNLDKSVKALYIMGENPAMTEPDIQHVAEKLKMCEFLVIQDIFPTETSKFADVILPAATFAEKDGTFTNTERRIQKLSPLFAPMYNSKTDFEILTALANILISKMKLKPSGNFSSWNYSSYEDVMNEINGAAPIYEKVNYEIIQKNNVCWPVNSKYPEGAPILHQESFSRGKGRFFAIYPQRPHEIVDENFPLILNTGRELYHWHGGELTRRVDELSKISDHPVVLIHSEDAKMYGIKDNSNVKIISKRGEIIAKAFITERNQKGTIFGNFHFYEGNVNTLTAKALDQKAKIPQYKISAVKIQLV